MAESRMMIAYLEDHKEPGSTFEAWPRHVTMLPWFFCGEELALNALHQGAVILRATNIVTGPKQLGPIDDFGTKKRPIPVRLVGESTQLGVMHGVLLVPLLPAIIETSWIGGMYNPHASNRDQPDPGEGYKLMIDSLSLVRHDDTHKTVIETVTLRSPEDD